MKDDGIEYNFSINNYILFDGKLSAFNYNMIMQYEDNSPGVFSEKSTYTFNAPVEVPTPITLNTIISLLTQYEECDSIEKTSIFKNAYQKMIESTKTEHIACSGQEWLLSTLL
jgi:hypothetical protein